MATNSDVLCGICDSQHITKSANKWCPECDEGLCSGCQTYHSFSKATRNHEAISIENYLKLPSAILKIATYCNDHNLKYQNFCPQHDKICCSVCISEYHNNCCGLKSLQEIVKTSKESAWIESIEENLKDMRNNYENIKKDIENNLTTVENQRKHFHEEIKQIRAKINSHLDLLEQQIIEELNAVEQKVQSSFETLISQIIEKTKTIETLQSNISTVKEYASDLQIFLGSKSLEAEVGREKTYLESLFKDGSLSKNKIKCDISEKISDILSTITTFGSVSIDISQPLIVFKKDKENQAQILSAVPCVSPKSLDGIRISLKKQLPFVSNQSMNGLRGFSVSQNETIQVLSNRHGQLGIMNTNGTFDLIKKYSSPCFGVAFIDDSTIAAYVDKTIEIVNTVSKVTERVIPMQGECTGICYYNGKLFCNVLSKGIQEVSLSNGNITDLVIQNDLNSWPFITVHNDKIYQTSSGGFVKCYTTKGEMLWKFKATAQTRGIAVDNSNNVYVALHDINYIALISADGQKSRQLEINNITENAWGLHFNSLTNSLAVVCVDGTILLYDILCND
ncbi:uncharacterized protein LOC134714161 [Mytilus trossulus]|uniref:uncharacterized protein LOC134714161 n=1 Tax=Mytilus trossulus TaxID=6551 RepID=UPI003006956D